MLPTRALLTALTSLAFVISGAPAQDQTAHLVKDANTDPSPYSINIGWVAPLGNNVVFAKSTPADGNQLWVSNGKPADTRPIVESTSGLDALYPATPVPFGEGAAAKVAFHRALPEDASKRQIWVTDGTEAGTLQVFLSTHPTTSSDTTGTTSGIFLTHWARGMPDGGELIFSDGTPAGTRSLNPSVPGGIPRFKSATIFFASGPWCYFGTEGHQIWRSDGTEAGTTKLATFSVSPISSLYARPAGSHMFVSSTDLALETHVLWSCPIDGGEPVQVYAPGDSNYWQIARQATAGDQFHFLAQHEDYSVHLITSDGTAAGTHEIPIPVGADEDLSDASLTSWHGDAYLMAFAWNSNTEQGISRLYLLDGTSDDLQPLGTLPYGGNFYNEAPWREQEDSLYFFAYNEQGEWDLWQTHGTPASTRRMKRAHAPYLTGPSDSLIASTPSGVFYAASGGPGTYAYSLWRQPRRGKAGGAVRLTRTEKWTAQGIPQFDHLTIHGEPAPYEMVNGSLLSFVTTGRGQYELWRMDPDGRRAKAIWKPSGTHGLYGYDLAFHGTTPHGAVFFYFDAEQNILKIMGTDGTRRGTRVLVDHHPSVNPGFPYSFAQAGGFIYYATVDAGTSGAPALWKTDGTPEGTSKVLTTGGISPAPATNKLVSFEGRIYFIAPGTGENTALWRSDGTPEGTIILCQNWPVYHSGTPADLAAAGGKLLFSVQLGTTQSLWQSDGTAAGTVPVTPAANFARTDSSHFTDLGNGVALFHASLSGSSPQRWWRHDATGTFQVPIPLLSGAHFFGDDWDKNHAVANGRVFYNAHGQYNQSLWVTDGTVAGTHEIGGPISNSVAPPRHLLAVGNVVYFNLEDRVHGYELWRSDGTEEGTVIASDIDPGAYGSDPEGLKLMNGKLYFNADRRDVGRELFSIDLPQQ